MALFFVLASQFLSALGDNALLFTSVALVKAQHYPGWTFPVLQELFVFAYIVLAAFAGPLADAFPKGTVLMVANIGKLVGAVAMLIHVNPFLSYGLVGVGAALYSPAKYGILGELLPEEKLVKANGMMEGTTIFAILFGVVAGAKLADWNISVALGMVAGAYFLAGLVNLGIPKLKAAHKLDRLQPIAIIKEFAKETRPLWADHSSRVALLGTSAFWGAGAALRFLLIAWAPFVFHTSDDGLPADLNAVTAVGIVLGAAFASWKFPLERSKESIGLGVYLGVTVLVISQVHTMTSAVLLLVLVGALGGGLVVPLNALLQARGASISGAGHVVAVQNLFESTAMLAALLGEAVLTRLGMNPVHQLEIFGSIMAISMALLRQASLNRAGARLTPF